MSCGAPQANVCAECGTELPAEAKFCFGCGASVGAPAAAAAPATPAAPPAPATDATIERLSQYVPPELLQKLEAAQAGHEMLGERRIVTMLFCDVSGSTAAAESMDPEEWAGIINGAFEHLIAPVYKYEGTLARLMGDAILAFFGAPIAHEDDPQRAVLAGLEILEAIKPFSEEVKAKWGIEISVRVGINTGLVVVGEVGSDLRVEYTALGDAINVAARMEQTAEPDTLQITADTQRLIAPFFDFEDIGGVEVKGKIDPIQSYRVHGIIAQPGQLRGIEGLDSPLVGRVAEIESLRTAVTELADGRGQVVSVMGDAGLGKSRLVAELRRSASEQDGLMWLEGRSLSYETDTPYAPFRDILQSAVDTVPGYATAATHDYDLLKSALTTLCPIVGPDISPHLAHILGIDVTGPDVDRVRYLDPPHAKEKTFNGIVQLVETISNQHSVVMVLDDLHWVDPTSLELVKELLPVADRAPLMLVGVFRPIRTDRSWEFQEMASRDFAHRHVEINLSPLTAEDARSLVSNLLEVDDLPLSLRQMILDKSEGNPFFLEEVIRSLLDRDLVIREDGHWKATEELAHLEVPDTLNGVLTARLDSLDIASKRLAQIAAVIGREFDEPLLLQIADSGTDIDSTLLDLQRRELIREKGRVPHRSFIFKHAMTQETAYASLLLADRRTLHGRAGTALAESNPGGVSDIARHFVGADQLDEALPFLVQSADQASAAYAAEEAIKGYERACEIVEARGEEADITLSRQVFEGLGGILNFANRVDEAIKTYERMSEIGKLLYSDEIQVSAMNKIALLSALRKGELDFAQDTLERAEVMALHCADLDGQAERHMTNCYIQTTLGDFDRAYDSLQIAARIGRETGTVETRLFGLSHIANTLTYMTRFDEALEMSQEALDLAIEHGHRSWEAELKSFPIPFYYLANGDFERALEISSEARALANEIGAVMGESVACVTAALSARLMGRFDLALEASKRGLEIASEGGLTYLQAGSLAEMGATELDIDPARADRTKDHHAVALSTLEQPLGTAMQSLVLAEVGFCALMMGDIDQATKLFNEGLVTSSAPKLLARPQLLLGSALVNLMGGNPDKAKELANEAEEFAIDHNLKHYAPFFGLVRGMIYGATEEHPEAVAALKQACMSGSEMGMKPVALMAATTRHQMHVGAGEPEEQANALAEAEKLISEISSSINDDEVRGAFKSAAEAKLVVEG